MNRDNEGQKSQINEGATKQAIENKQGGTERGGGIKALPGYGDATNIHKGSEFEGRGQEL